MALFHLYHDKINSVIITPVSDRIKIKIDNHLREYGQMGWTALIPEWDLPEIPARKRKELLAGYPVTVRLDLWETLHYFGYDTHCLAE